ncbi:MAG: hypothetical protein KY444_07445, partial [Gemmatimonadetes bacterium]|nr:hypothetical protein [Gemmatimonadota bacterium]
MPEGAAGVGRRRVRGLWLGSAVALSTATQLRPGIPVGPGEVLLAGWVVASLGSVLWKNRLELSPVARSFGLFWAASFVLLLSGLLVGLLAGLAFSNPFHDLLAYTLVAALVMLVLSKAGGVEELHAAVPVAMFLSTAALVAVLVASFPGRTLGPREPWIGTRFMGWSKNPNQVALAMSTVPFLAWYRLAQARRRGARALYVVIALLGLLMGLATLSDSLVVAWGACLAVLVGWGWL